MRRHAHIWQAVGGLILLAALSSGPVAGLTPDEIDSLEVYLVAALGGTG